MSREVIHLEPPKVPLLGKPEEVRAGHETEDKDREKKEKEEAFEALYNNRKDVKGGLGEGRGRVEDSKGGLGEGRGRVEESKGGLGEEKGGVRESKGGKVWKRWVVGGVIGLVVAGGVVMGASKGWVGGDKGVLRQAQDDSGVVQGDRMGDKGEMGEGWYAVHLADGKVYYGRLSKVETEYPELTQVFYEQEQINADMSAGRQEITHPRLSGDPSQEGNATTTEGMVKEVPNAGKVGAGNGGRIVLVKLGTEVSRPEDRIVINKQNLLYYERLSADSPIVRAIENYLSGR